MPDEASHLYESASRGDPVALDQMLEHYLPQLHAFVRARIGPQVRARESSIDVVQSVCRELLGARAGFDFQGEERFRAWLFVAALNKVRERLRRLHSGKRNVAREIAIEDVTASKAEERQPTPSQEAIGRETDDALTAALAALSEEHREVITLARLVRLPHRVIAEVMARSEDATRQLLARAMVQLVREMERRGVDVEHRLPGGSSR